MIDYGTRQTDLAVKRAEWRLSRVYRQAQRDIDEKLKDWKKRHQEREKRYRQQLADGKISQADFDAWMRGQVFQDKQWQARKAEIDRILLNADREAQRIVNEGKIGVFADNANYIGYDLERNGNVNTGFMLYDQNTVGRLIKSDPQILPKARPGVQKDKAYIYYNKLMNSAITQGIIQGETIPQIAKRIIDKTGESSYKSAVRNARTAYTGAQNAGRMEGLHQAQRLGIKVKKKWMATLDSRTRDTHADLDGQIAEVDDPFVTKDDNKIMFPGDPTAKASEVYNCRCTLVYVYPEYPSEMQRRDNETGENVGDMTYREWEEMKRESLDESVLDKKEAKEYRVREGSFQYEELEERTNRFLSRMDAEDAERYGRAIEEAPKTYDDTECTAYDPRFNNINYNMTASIEDDTTTHETTHYLDFNTKIIEHESYTEYKALRDENGVRIRDKDGRVIKGQVTSTYDVQHSSVTSYISYHYRSEERAQDYEAAHKVLGVTVDATSEEKFMAFMNLNQRLYEKGISQDDRMNLFDTLSGVLTEEIPISLLGGHDRRYWERDADNLPSEALAGYAIMRTAKMTELLELQKQIAPNLYGYLEKGYDMLWQDRSKPVEIFTHNS